MNVDVFPIGKGGFPASYVRDYRRVLPLEAGLAYFLAGSWHWGEVPLDSHTKNIPFPETNSSQRKRKDGHPLIGK